MSLLGPFQNELEGKVKEFSLFPLISLVASIARVEFAVSKITTI
jgi:hypothetical protein